MGGRGTGTPYRDEAERLERQERSRKRNVSTTIRIQREKRLFLDQIKARAGCGVCRVEFDPIVLDFHHRDRETKHPKLRRSGGHKVMADLSWPDLAREIELCEILCANCHRRATRYERETEYSLYQQDSEN